MLPDYREFLGSMTRCYMPCIVMAMEKSHDVHCHCTRCCDICTDASIVVRGDLLEVSWRLFLCCLMPSLPHVGYISFGHSFPSLHSWCIWSDVRRPSLNSSACPSCIHSSVIGLCTICNLIHLVCGSIDSSFKALWTTLLRFVVQYRVAGILFASSPLFPVSAMYSYSYWSNLRVKIVYLNLRQFSTSTGTL